MKLHILNPEHDIALASGLANFTAPHAGRQLRHDLGFLPALWAGEDDIVVAEDVELATRSWNKLKHKLSAIRRMEGRTKEDRGTCQFVSVKQLAGKAITEIDPWGWDSALCALLLRRGVRQELLHTEEQLAEVRRLSHRRTAAQLLPLLQQEGTVGEMFECHTAEEVEPLLQRYGQLVLKAPWSSSGRGLRFLSLERTPFSQHAGWFRNHVAAQECVMVEPFYRKIKDFGMEFYADGEGHIDYCGLSFFHTENGAYTGNILATEAMKTAMLARYVNPELLNSVKKNICKQLESLFGHQYRGPFGVDMMVVANSDHQFLLHPCVEINLRRTMGHVALALSPQDDDILQVMRINYSEDAYHLTLNRL